MNTLFRFVLCALVGGVIFFGGAWWGGQLTNTDLSNDVLLPKAASAQFGVNYYWGDAIAITTASIDSAFAVRWEQATIYADVDLLIRAAAPPTDTTSWSSRDFVSIPAGTSITFGPATPLGRLEFKASTTSGTMYMAGYKRSAQF